MRKWRQLVVAVVVDNARNLVVGLAVIVDGIAVNLLDCHHQWDCSMPMMGNSIWKKINKKK